MTPDTRILDLGCGPGLYAKPLAQRVGHVHGIDLSATAITVARRRATSDRATFDVGDYLTAPLPRHDVALLLMCDYCAMSPSSRSRLLQRVHAAMAPDARLVLDVHSEQRYGKLEEPCAIGLRLMDGFWAPGQYVAVHQTLLYDDVRVSLDRYLVAERNRTRWVHNWLAHLTSDELRGELAEAGFATAQLLGDVTGRNYDAESSEFAVVATRA